MNQQQNYARIAKAIEYIQDNFKQQPSLAELAAYIHLSEAHFQRLFSEWAGVSPKKFLQYMTLEHAKQILKREQDNSIFAAGFYSGLSSSSRVHDLFIQIEAMTPAEYKHGAAALTIRYSTAESLFGKLLIASTHKGICYIAFFEDFAQAFTLLQRQFPQANFVTATDPVQQQAIQLLQTDPTQLSTLKLHLKGSAFQLKVWESLLKIPTGHLVSYSSIAKDIGQHQAARAVGSAIAHNPVAFLIPCHRVIQASGHFGAYMWGNTRKTALIAWESAKTQVIDHEQQLK